MRVTGRLLVTSLVISAGLGACGGDGDGDGGSEASSLPAPPSGKATVGGKFTKDGKPQAGEEVSLAVGGKTRLKAKTDPSGQFVFRNVTPAKYTLGAGVTISGQTGQTVKCKVPGYQSFTITGTTQSGGQVAITSLTSDPFDVGSGDRTVKDVVVTCGEE